MVVTGSVKGLKKGTLLLQKLDDTLLVSVDSVQIDGNPDFKLTAEVESPEMYYLYLRLKNGTLLDERIPFFAEATEINIETSLKKFGNDALVSGSVNHDKFMEYKKLMQRYTNRNLELIEAAFEARQQGNDSLVKNLTEQQSKVLASKYLATVNYAVNQKAYEVAPYLMLSEVYDANIKYLDTVYNSLGTEIRESKYGRDLAAFIKVRKKLE
jgi:hypothetical protein